MIDSNTEQTRQKPDQKDWEKQTMERILMASIDEQRKSRRWGIFFKFFFGGYLLLLLIIMVTADFDEEPITGNFTALVV